MDCPICLNPIEGTNCCTTECGHQFHSSCIFKNFTNSVACPMCRKELVEVPKEDDEESEWETDSELSNEEDDNDEEYEEDEEEEEQDKRKITIRQAHEALKKKGYTETDFISFIISDYFDFKVKVSQEVETRSEQLIVLLEKICYEQIAVDHRDNRSYASVLQGATRTEEPGAGPIPVQIL